MNRHLLAPTKGFTRTVMETRKTLVINDIWAASLKNPVGSMIIMPIKRGSDVFCTIELSRYRGKPAFESITSQPRHSSVVTAR